MKLGDFTLRRAWHSAWSLVVHSSSLASMVGISAREGRRTGPGPVVRLRLSWETWEPVEMDCEGVMVALAFGVDMNMTGGRVSQFSMGR